MLIVPLVLLVALSALVLAAMLYPASLLRWFQRKRYQYEVTFSLYMLTSTEKFIFSAYIRCNHPPGCPADAPPRLGPLPAALPPDHRRFSLPP
jgi:hypothetical protein